MRQTKLRTIKCCGLGLALAAMLTTAAKASFTTVDSGDISDSLSSSVLPGGATAIVGATITSQFPSGSTTGTGDIAGSLTTTVYTDSTGLLFAYTLTSDSSPPKTDNIGELSLNGYSSLTSASIAYDPLSAANSVGAAGWINPDVLQFSLNLKQGGDLTIYVQTTATSYSGNFASAQDGEPIGHIADFAPVPEPSTLMAGALLVLPFGASTLRIMRKKVVA